MSVLRDQDAAFPATVSAAQIDRDVVGVRQPSAVKRLVSIDVFIVLENTPDKRCHDNGESESDGVMCKEILVVHLFLYGVGFALDGFRVCEDRAVARRVDASDKLFPEGKALQDAEDLVQGELEVPSLGAACPGEEETEKNRIADEQMNRYGNGHDIVEYGMDKS